MWSNFLLGKTKAPTPKLRKQYRSVLPLYCNQASSITNHKWYFGNASSLVCFTARSQHEFPSTFVITKAKPTHHKGHLQNALCLQWGGGRKLDRSGSPRELFPSATCRRDQRTYRKPSCFLWSIGEGSPQTDHCSSVRPF